MRTLHDIMSSKTWVQRRWGVYGSACLGHATILYVSELEWWHLAPLDGTNGVLIRVGKICHRLFPERSFGDFPLNDIADFNDHPETTIEDVLKVCRAFDEEEEEEEVRGG